MTPYEFADDVFAKSYKDADVYGETTLNDVFIENVENVGAPMRRGLRKYWAPNPLADLTDISFYAESLLLTQKRSGNIKTNIYINKIATRLYKEKLWKSRNIISNANKDFVSSQAPCKRRQSPPWPVQRIKLLNILTLSSGKAPI